MLQLRTNTEQGKPPLLTMDEEVWRPNPGPQTLLVTCPIYEVFYGGARGGGKTDGLLGDFMEGVNKYGHAWRGIFFRRTYPELEEVIRRSKEIYYRVFPGAIFLTGSKTWYFPSGATLKMRYMEKDDDVMNYQGHGYSWIALDEITTWPTPYCYDTIKACARSPHGAPVRIRLSGNPGGPGHHWVKDRFIDNSPPLKVFKDAEGLERVFIPSFVWDNPKWEQADPDYIKRLKALADPSLRRAWLLGDWDAFIGQVFEEWRRKLHTCRPYKLPEWWRRFMSCDWGYGAPFAIHWYAVDPEDRCWMYREWYGQRPGARANTGVRLTADVVAQKIVEIEKKAGEKIEYRVMSPDAWMKKGEEGPTIAESFEDVLIDNHMVDFDQANNDRLNGLYQCHLRLKHQPPDSNGKMVRPMFVVFDTCSYFIKTIPPLGHDKHNVEDVDKNAEDHSYESWRYGMMSRPMASAEPLPKEKKWLKKKKRASKSSWKTV